LITMKMKSSTTNDPSAVAAVSVHWTSLHPPAVVLVQVEG
jgi:hypothetical protein